MMEIFPLTESGCLEMLKNYGIDVSNPNFKILRYEFNLRETLYNELSSNRNIFRLHIRYEMESFVTECLTVLVKSPISSPAYVLLRDTGVYDTEYILYSEVFPAIRKLNKDSFAPRFCGGNPNLPAIVIEDLQSKGYELYTLPNQLNYKIIFRYMAKMHALSVVLNKTISIPDKLKSNTWNARTFYTRAANQLISSLNASVRAKYADKVRLFKNTAVDKLMALNEEGFKTLIHGNLWYPNILFKREKGYKLPQRTAFVNFENARWDNPAFDIWYFVISNGRVNDFSHQFESLLEAYSDTMNDIFKAHDMPIYSLADLKVNVYKNCLFALCVCGAMEPIFGALNKREFDVNNTYYHWRRGRDVDLCSKWFEYFARRDFLAEGRFPTKW